MAEWVLAVVLAMQRRLPEAANRGSAPVVIYIATLLEAGAPLATPVSLPPTP